MSSRRLAAIVAADVVGYSRLMGVDEEGTLARLKEHRRELIDPGIARHRGRIVKTTGDGLLVEFASAVDAVRCAVELQERMRERNAGVADTAAVVFRIGINLGDIIIDGDDIHGDGVNVAARLEAEAPAGGIVLAGAVHDAVTGRVKAAFQDLGDLSLKNIERPVRAYRVRVEGGAAEPSAAPLSRPAEAPLALPDKPSIAVLPFLNMSGDPEQEYFADGLVEDIITALSSFKSLFVIARNSSFTYKGRAVDIKQVGRELGVRYVLEGSVRKAAGRLRITGQLIDAGSGTHLWGGRFDGSLEDIFDLQDQMTSSVVGAIAPKIDQAELERARRKPVEKLDAYDCFLRGLPHLRIVTREAQDEALRFFYRAIELDPDFATPYGYAGRCYAHRRAHRWFTDRDREQAETRRLALRVSAIGRDDALALVWAGFALVSVCREYELGPPLIDHDLSINPNLSIGWALRGRVSSWLGDHEAAIEPHLRALRLSPMDADIVYMERNLGAAYFNIGRYDEAVKWLNQARARNPDDLIVLRNLTVACALSGDVAAARRIVARMLELEPTMRMANLGDYIALRRPEDIERFARGLRLAGVPE